MKGTKLGLLFLFLAFGSTVETAWQVRNRVGPLALGPTGCRVLRGNFQGPSFEFSDQKTESLEDGKTLEVTNSFGGVRISAGEPGQVAVTLRKKVYRPTEALAREYAPRIQLKVERAGDILRVGTNREALEAEDEASQVGFETHLEITVPAETKVRVANEHGDARVTDVLEADVESSFDAIVVERIRGPVGVRGRHGDVTVSMVRGTLSLSSRHGTVQVEDVEQASTIDAEHGGVSLARVAGASVTNAQGAVRADTVKGDLVVRSRHAEVSAKDVTGKVDVETSFGHVDLARVGGDALVRTQHAGVAAADLGGGLDVECTYDGVRADRVKGPVTITVDHGGVRASGLEKGGRIKATGDSIELDGVRGAFEIDADRADVMVRPSGPLTEPLRVTARHGSIELAVPAGSRFVMKASAQTGEVTADVPGLALTQTGHSHVEGRLGDGASEVVLATEGHGDVKVRAAAVVAEKKAE